MATNIDTSDLSELNAIFKDMGGVEKVEEYTNNFEELADGNYLCEIEKVEDKNSKKTGRPMIEIQVAVEGGQKEWVYLMLAGENLKKTQTAIGGTITRLKKLGVDVSSENIGIIIENAKELVGTRCNLEIKTNNEFRNKELTLA